MLEKAQECGEEPVLPLVATLFELWISVECGNRRMGVLVVDNNLACKAGTETRSL